MNKHNFKMGTFLALFLLTNLSIANVVWSQTELDRLERQIRQRVGQDQQPPPQPAITPQQAASQAAKEDSAENKEPAYLGLLADDRQDRGRGVRVLDVSPNGPAAKGGLKKQDLITAVAGVRTRQMSEMGDVLDLYGPGESVEFDILRDNKPQKVKVTLGRRSAPKAAAGTETETIPSPPGEVVESAPTQAPLKKAAPAEGGKKPSVLELFNLNAPKSNENKNAKTNEIPEPTLNPPRPAETGDRPTVEQLQKRIEELERRVAELEKALQERKDDK